MCESLPLNYDNVKKAHSREVLELKKLSKRTIDLVIPKYHGEVETNLGLGHVFDLILATDGSHLPNLQFFLESYPESALETLEKLRRDLKQSKGVYHDLRTDNILVLNNGGKFAIIDGFGDWAFIKFCSYSSYLAKKKVDRKLKHVVASIDKILTSKNLQPPT